MRIRLAATVITVGVIAATSACASPAAQPSAAGAVVTTSQAPVTTISETTPPVTTVAPTSIAPTTTIAPTHSPTTSLKPSPKPTVTTSAQADSANGKEVLLDFGASWCGNCQAMDALLKTSTVAATISASYHLVQYDIGGTDATSTKNMELLGKYDSSGNYALPVLIVISPSGAIRVDTNKSGNPSFDESGFEAFLRKWTA